MYKHTLAVLFFFSVLYAGAREIRVIKNKNFIDYDPDQGIFLLMDEKSQRPYLEIEDLEYRTYLLPYEKTPLLDSYFPGSSPYLYLIYGEGDSQSQKILYEYQESQGRAGWSYPLPQDQPAGLSSGNKDNLIIGMKNSGNLLYFDLINQETKSRKIFEATLDFCFYLDEENIFALGTETPQENGYTVKIIDRDFKEKKQTARFSREDVFAHNKKEQVFLVYKEESEGEGTITLYDYDLKIRGKKEGLEHPLLAVFSRDGKSILTGTGGGENLKISTYSLDWEFLWDAEIEAQGEYRRITGIYGNPEDMLVVLGNP